MAQNITKQILSQNSKVSHHRGKVAIKCLIFNQAYTRKTHFGSLGTKISRGHRYPIVHGHKP